MLPSWAIQGDARRDRVGEAEGSASVPSWTRQRARREGSGSVEEAPGREVGARREGSESVEAVEAPLWAEQSTAINHAKLMLYQFLMLLYAVCKISARDLCILFYWIEQCGLQGEWDGMGLAPGAQTGKYQQHLDKLLPNPRRDLPFYKIKTPLNNKDGDRVVVPKRFIPAHSVLEQEMRERPPPHCGRSANYY